MPCAEKAPGMIIQFNNDGNNIRKKNNIINKNVCGLVKEHFFLNEFQIRECCQSELIGFNSANFLLNIISAHLFLIYHLIYGPVANWSRILMHIKLAIGVNKPVY